MRTDYGLSVLFRVVGCLALSAWLLLIGPASTQAEATPAPSPVRQEADPLYAEKSYALALDDYRGLLAALPKSDPERTQIEYRIAVALGKSPQWDDAFTAINTFINDHKSEPLWEARGLYQRGLWLNLAPQQGYQVGKQIYRGNNYPHVDSSETPQYVNLQEDDQKNAVADFERALKDYDGLPKEQRASVASEEADLCFDLARLLPNAQFWGTKEDWGKAKTIDWSIDPVHEYDASWTAPKKVLYLYARIPVIVPADSHRIVLAALGKALYIVQWGGIWELRKSQETLEAGNSQNSSPTIDTVIQSIPYHSLDGLIVLKDAVSKYPLDSQAPQLRLMIAKWLGNRGDYVSALDQYRLIVAQYPHCRWIVDAQDGLHRILNTSLNVSTPGMQPENKNAAITINSHNVKQLVFHAFSVPLATILDDPELLNDPSKDMERYESVVGNAYNTTKLGPEVARWTYQTKDKGDYAAVKATISMPLVQSGAYLIEVEGDGGTVHDTAFVIISGLAIVHKRYDDSLLTFVSEADTGQPVPDANVTVRNIYGWQGRDQHDPESVVDVSRARCDTHGLLMTPLQQHVGYYLSRTDIFVDAPGQRYAMDESSGQYPSQDDRNPAGIQGYVYTDRAVYCPGQPVYFRGIIAKPTGQGADYLPLSGQTFQVKITDAKGQSIFDKSMTVNQYGTIHDTLLLGKGAPLGDYIVTVTYPIPKGSGPLINADQGQCGFTSFSVEEYKKPEFIVRVTPSTTQAKFGDTVTAKIAARYYSSGSVSHSAVTYHIYRSKTQIRFVFPQPFDWLYSSGRYDLADEFYPGSRELVVQGAATTDDNGVATVTFRADKGSGEYQGDYSYIITADVVDRSRHQITGEGSLHVSRQRFYAALNLPQTFVREDEPMKIDLHTQDANQKPLSSTGALVVDKLTFDLKTGKETALPVYSQMVTTSADGNAVVDWSGKTGGQYRVSFAAHDSNNISVTTEAPFWIAGTDLARNSFKVDGLALMTDKSAYEEGDTARVFIVGHDAGDWVLLTQDGGQHLIQHDLIQVSGYGKILDIPITKEHVTGFMLTALVVRNYAAFRAYQQVNVPPTHKFMTMAVTGDKAEYRPGEVGTFHVKTTDFQGRPVASEVSLGVTDTSLDYIQQSFVEDIRSFYYSASRGDFVNTNDSLGEAFSSLGDYGPYTANVQPHGFVMPDMGRLFQGVGQSSTDRHRYYRMGYYDVLSLTGKPITPIVWDGRRFVIAGDVNFRFYGGGIGGQNPAIGGELGGAAYEFPGLVCGVPGVTFDPSGGYVHLRGSDENAVGFQVDGISNTNSSDNQFNTNIVSVSLKQARVRSNFADTAFWTPAVVTDAKDGTATVNVTFPDTLTTWKASARGTTADVLVGTDETNVVTTKHLLVRLESPRFFVERDQVTLSAIVMNTLKTAKQVRVSLATDTSLLDAADATREISVPAGGEQRVDWTARVKGAGTADITMTAETDEESDAVRQSFPVLEYGVQKFIAGGGVLKDADTTQSFSVTIPHDHKAGSSALLVQVTPSLAATAIDALPYLADYPYGCIEQTLSRFVPTVLVASALRDAGVDLDTLHKRALALQEREAQPSPLGQAAETTNDTDQTGYTYPHGTPGVLKTPMLAPELQFPYWYGNPVFDPDRLASMEQDGLSRLTSMQRSDGGFGWWPYSAEEDPYMSAYALYSLCAARDAGVVVPGDMISRAASYLETYVKKRDDDPNIAVWAAFAITRAEPMSPTALHVAQAMYRQREKLSPYGEALLALTLHVQKRDGEAGIVCRNLVDTARIDRENGTASWESPAGFWWYWYNDDTETTAWVLQALIAVDPKSDLSPMLVKWLVRHKLGSGWETTKATAMVVGALMQYVRLTHELDPDYTLTVALGDKIKRTFTVNRENALLFDNAFLVPDSLLTDGAQTVTITKSGTGRCYYASSLQYFTTEEQIKGAGTELKVRRRYYRLSPRLAKRHDWTGDAYNALDYDRTELTDGAVLKSGDMIEVELILDTKNDYDYVAFEDMKPAGCEPIDLRSGGRYGDGLCSDMELRDTKTAFFVDHLPQGTRVLRYRLRAEIPGAFHALPCNAYAMYAPGVRALSDSQHFTIEDAPIPTHAATRASDAVSDASAR